MHTEEDHREAMCRGILSVEDEYMTVGELAKRVGITVRAIQYYDQRGLLPPSQIGSSNQRLIDLPAPLRAGRFIPWSDENRT